VHLLGKIKKIFFIIGTRPQIIKIQPIYQQLSKDGYEVKIINTGQHYDYDLSTRFFEDLDLVKPHINLGVGKGSPPKQIAKIISKLEIFLNKENPQIVIIPGDTTSALAAAITSSKCKIPIAHLEAGARSNQYHMAEEINRRMIDHCSHILFAPTKLCKINLKNENVFGNCYFVGDTMYDLFLKVRKEYKFHSHKLNSKQILLTIHRVENIDNREKLKKIVTLMNKLSKSGFEIVFPIHPHTKVKLKEFGLDIEANKIKPLGYFELMKILDDSSMVITDSGGLQKEAYWMGKPCITIRDNTEWKETINEHANFLMNLSKPFSVSKINKISKIIFKPKGSLFGNGKASENISKIFNQLNKNSNN
jgi:UDP-N-acetylglucosamine 2-epimerase